MGSRAIAAEERVAIVGAGGHGSELASYIQALEASGARVCLVGFVDERKPAGSWGGNAIIGSLDDLRRIASAGPASILHYITAVGDNETRRQLVARVERLPAENLAPWILRHPAAYVGRDVEVGDGTCLAPGSILTTRVRIGKHCIVNVNASISHDSTIGDFANVNPGAVICGNVKVGEGCYIGAGATVIDGVSIGDWTVIGAGAVVTQDVPADVTAVGVPARVIKRHAARGAR